MNVFTKKRIQLLNEQMIASMLFIGTIIISILLTYDEIKDLSNQKKLFSNKISQNISLYNRIIVVILALYFLYNSYINQKIAQIQKKDLKYLKLQTLSSTLTLISTIIVLYVIIQNYKNSNFNVSQVENPVL